MDLDKQHADNAQRRYSYTQDERMHKYMVRAFGLEMWYSKRILELGCFRGSFTRLLMELYTDVTVVEGAGDLIFAASKAAPGATFHQSLFEDWHPDGVFDQIFLLHTLEHIDDPGLLLQRIRTWLAPKGRLYVAVPNAFAASRQIAVEMGVLPHPWSIMDGEAQQGHRRTYDLTYLKRTVTDAGLKIVDSGGIFFKALSNHQLDLAHGYGVINDAYLEGCYQLGKQYPELCSSIYVICEKG